MAGQYFYDPRPFYGHNGSNGLMPMDELFYGRYEPVPYWMDQRMTAFEEYYPGHKPLAMGRPLQQSAYKRPESRDDIGVDMYRRSPYNFHGVAAPMSYGAPHPRQQSQDDTWVHAMTPQQHHHHNHITRGDQYRQPEYQPHGNMSNHRGLEMPVNNRNRGNNMTNSGYNHGSLGNKQMSTGFNNSYNGGKAMKPKQGSSNVKPRYDSSSEDSEDDYTNSGAKWATKTSNKHSSGHQKTGSKGSKYYESVSSQHAGSKGNNSYGYESVSSRKSGRAEVGGSSQSKISKLLRFQDGGSSDSDSDDQNYGHSRKSSKGNSKLSNHGNFQNYGHQQQSKHMQYGNSYSKGVELKVPICCDNCERKVKECLEYMDGVENVLCDQWNRKVIVYGNVKPESVLKRVRRVKKASALWQQAKQQQTRAY